MIELFRSRFGPVGPVGQFELVVGATVVDDGDMRPGAAALTARQLALTGRTWTMATEDHGVVVVDADAGPADACGALVAGDVLVSRSTQRALAIWAADCAPVVLCGRRGTLVMAHAGWRGLAAGVLDVAVDEVLACGDEVAAAVLGPCIHPECYAFGSAELAAVAAGTGLPVASIRSRNALDIPATIAGALRRRGLGLDVIGPCTACDGRFYSHRARADVGRHAVVAWTTTPATRLS